jgi:hypothetical protein
MSRALFLMSWGPTTCPATASKQRPITEPSLTAANAVQPISLTGFTPVSSTITTVDQPVVSKTISLICSGPKLRANLSRQAMSPTRCAESTLTRAYLTLPTSFPSHRGHHDAGMACKKSPTANPAIPSPNSTHPLISSVHQCAAPENHELIRHGLRRRSTFRCPGRSKGGLGASLRFAGGHLARWRV